MVAMSLPAHWLNSSRIYKTTATTNSRRRYIQMVPLGSASASERKLLYGIFLVVALVSLLAGCSSIRPIVKIGLIAPFEGLYRQSGYVALDAMRQAMIDCTPPGVDVLPLALDDNGDPRQAQ